MSADKEFKAFIDRILRLKEEQDAIGGDIRDIYGEAKGRGYDKTVMGKLVAYLRKIEKAGSQTVDEQESIFETYLASYQGTSGTRVATHTHEKDHDPITGEVRASNPRLVKQVVDGMQTEAGRAALVAAVDIMIEGVEAEENQELVGSFQATDTSLTTRAPFQQSVVVDERPPAFFHTNSPETASTGPKVLDGRSGVGPESRHHSDVSGDDAGQNLTSNYQPETATAQRVNGHSQHEGANAKATVRNEVVTVVGTESGTVANSEIAPAAQGEAEAPSAEHVSPQADEAITGSAAANAGECPDEMNTDRLNTNQGRGLVNISTAHKPLRPLCLRPDACGGYGDKTCHSCLVAARTTGEAA